MNAPNKECYCQESRNVIETLKIKDAWKLGWEDSFDKFTARTRLTEN